MPVENGVPPVTIDNIPGNESEGIVVEALVYVNAMFFSFARAD
jgi:hypothetical protein